MTQMHLLKEALRFLSKRTGVPYGELSNHMMVIGDVTRQMEMYGSIYGEPTALDYDFPRYNWDNTLNLISEIWHEDKEG